MYTPNSDKFTEIVDLTFHKYNSIDLKIWGLVKRNIGHRKVSDNSVIVQADVLSNIINTVFKYDINRINAISGAGLHKEATTIYFLNQLFTSMTNLTWVKLTLNKNSSFNRLTEIDEIKTIKFNIKTIRGTVRLFDIFHPAELSGANMLLIRSGILKPNESFKVFKLKSLLDKLDLYISENNSSDVMSLLNPIILKLEQFEMDDPDVLLITDYNSDI
ncbi:hypothetical protein OAC86_00610 [bacterium]|nr:hypothetical protein [bacterium]MDB9900027.1 hypothetical protein [bacterium]